MFACEQEQVSPDFLCLAKGLTGGYLPLAATLTTESIFEGFLNQNDGVDRTFYYGHSYCGNQVGCAVANASLEIFEGESVLEKLVGKIAILEEALAKISESPFVRDVRRCGFVAAVELGAANGESFPQEVRTGAAVCKNALKHGLLTRPILDSIVLMPPLCIADEQIIRMGEALLASITECCSSVGD